jgi:hypothetical protein
MAKCGRVEAHWTLSTSKNFDWTDSQGAGTAVVAAGDYTPTEYCAALQQAIRDLPGAIGASATVTLSNGEGGTGKVTVNSPNTPFSLQFPSGLAFATGFNANISSTSSPAVGDRHIVGMWLPGQVKWSEYGDIAGNSTGGTYITDYRATVSPTGAVHAVSGNYFRVFRLRWQAISRARAITDLGDADYVAAQGQSFEDFFRACCFGDSFVPVNPEILFTWNADDINDGTLTGRLLWPNEHRLEQFVSGWAARFNVDLPPLIVPMPS